MISSYKEQNPKFSLEMRRQKDDLVEFYKIMHGLEDLPSDLLFKTNSGRTREHHMRLGKNHVRLNTTKYFFSKRMIYLWNSLPSVIANSESVNEFQKSNWTTLRKTAKPLHKSTRTSCFACDCQRQNLTLLLGQVSFR